MPLFGRHSQNPAGSPQVLAGLQSLEQQAQQGNRQAAQALDDVAHGRTTHGTAVPGWNGDINWGTNDQGRSSERQAATDLEAGNGRFGQDASQAQAQHREWTGGALADALPTVVGAAGSLIGLPPALTGAVTGGLESATGLTHRGVLAGAGLGAAGGALGGAGAGAVRGAVNSAGGIGAAARQAIGAGGVAGVLGTARQTMGQGAPQSGQGGSGGSGGGVLGTGLSPLQAGLAALGTVQGAQRMGQADQYRSQALQGLQEQAAPNLSRVFADPGNPYRGPQPLNSQPNSAATAARRSLGY